MSLLSEALKTGKPDSAPVPLIAYGPHGEAETLRKARALGCDAVLSKRDFSQRLLELMNTRGSAVIPS